MLILSVQRRKSTPTDLIQQLAHMNHVCRQLLRERAAQREKARQEQEARERAMQREARERRERERREAILRGEVPPDHDGGMRMKYLIIEDHYSKIKYIVYSNKNEQVCKG